jgi:hypothetical protein
VGGRARPEHLRRRHAVTLHSLAVGQLPPPLPRHECYQAAVPLVSGSTIRFCGLSEGSGGAQSRCPTRCHSRQPSRFWARAGLGRPQCRWLSGLERDHVGPLGTPTRGVRRSLNVSAFRRVGCTPRHEPGGSRTSPSGATAASLWTPSRSGQRAASGDRSHELGKRLPGVRPGGRSVPAATLHNVYPSISQRTRSLASSVALVRRRCGEETVTPS